jgi:serine/threonine protein kinase
MNPEALIGMEVGKGVLQRLLGQGSMGAVYLATQSQRQVAIKIFFPASQLEQTDHEEFQQRLAQVIAQGARLDHKHILSVLDYGQQSGFFYQVMPYIAGENLQQLLKRSGPLPFALIQRYLEQLAAALDYAHTSGVLHRDIKPENILLTHDGDVLLADFGLAGLTTERNFACVRRAVPGMLNTIAPEYVLSQSVDERADLYSLGVVLYHMVTGRVPFQNASIIEVAMQHVKATPPAPSSLRTDLPQEAAQVIMRALAKKPTERYSCAQELASAFRRASQLSETAAKQAPDTLNALTTGTPAKRLAGSRNGGLFDPKWQAFASASTTQVQPSEQAPIAASGEPSEMPDKGLRRPGRLHLANLQVNALDASVAQEQNQAALHYVTLHTPSNQLAFKGSSVHGTGTLLDHATANNLPSHSDAPANRTAELQFSVPLSPLPQHEQASSTIKPVEPSETAQAPVEESRFQKGFWPQQASGKRAFTKKRRRVMSLVMVALVVVVGSGIFWFTQNMSSHQAHTTRDPHASTVGHAQATANANLILADDLSQNIHNWVVGAQGPFSYTFKDGAYLITNADKTNSAPALLPNKVLSAPFAYSLTMEQLQGDLSSPNNQFGMLLDATVHTINDKQIDTFYAFEVLNKPGGQYQFWKYDSSKDNTNPWTLLWSKGFGAEFLQGSGPHYINTLKVMDTGKNFTFMVNGTQVGMSQDGSFVNGSIGMLVNLNGAEVAFSHLLLTYM